MRGRSPLHVITAYGISNPWFVWSLQHGNLDGWCPACRGAGSVVTSPCENRDPPPDWPSPRCMPLRGCPRCRKRCEACLGQRVSREDVLRDEDFGDDESRFWAHVAFPGLRVRHGKRIDMHARAL